MIRIYNENEIKIMRDGGRILAKIMKEIIKEVKPGITTAYLNRVAEDLVFFYKTEPSFKGYEGFPTALCTSVNEEIVHAVPGKRKLKIGDIIGLDLGILYRPVERSVGLYGDMAVTVPVGKISEKKKKLIKVTKKALETGIKQAKSGNHLGDIGCAIQKYVEKNGFNVVRELVGHGVGKEVHEEPQIPNYGKRGEGPELQEGMVLAIEPMVTAGDWHIVKCADGFGFKTYDASLSAHFEHTVAITKKGPEILTQ